MQAPRARRALVRQRAGADRREARSGGGRARSRGSTRAAHAYPWAGEYTMWPGPNSNTFTAWVLRAVPELEADLPPTAIGKDYSGKKLLSSAPSGKGVQVSLFGLGGVSPRAASRDSK